MTNYQQELLRHLLQDMASAGKWLLRSFEICREIGIQDNYQAHEVDAFEALISRYVRAIDFIINKIFRTIDYLELEQGGTIIDLLNRMHQRGVIEDINLLREMKELRNEIAHEYANRQLQTIFQNVLQHTPNIFVLLEKSGQYCRKFDSQGN